MHRILSLFFAVTLTAVAAAAQYAQPRVSEVSLRSRQGHAAEQVSQAVMGTPLRLLSSEGDWWKVQTPEGYEGYVRSNLLSKATSLTLERWGGAPRVVVVSDRVEYITSDPEGTRRVSDVVPGAILALDPDADADSTAAAVAVVLPDGRRGFIPAEVVMAADEWVAQQWNPALLPQYAEKLLGTPYVWGGNTAKGMDCSGLVQLCALQQGVYLPRDAWQQASVGDAVDKTDFRNFLPGDLLFFGNTRTGKVTHVGISMGGARYIHSSGRVRISSLDRSDAQYENPGLLHVRRLTADGVARYKVAAHPLYHHQTNIR